MKRIAECVNCNSQIFRPIGKGWIHKEPRIWACSVQQAVDFHPHAEPK